MVLSKIQFAVFDKDGPPSRVIDRFEVQYNPAEYTVTKGVKNAPQCGFQLNSPPLHFLTGDGERLSMRLLFDSAEQGDGKPVSVEETTRKVYRLTRINPETHAPPKFRVTWGKRGLSFLAVAESVQQRFTLFSPDGTPLRAEVTLSMCKYEPVAAQLRETKPQSPDHTKLRVVRRGDTLAAVAEQEYDDAGAWRVIADHNPAVDPCRPKPGTLLRIPPLPAGAGAR